MKKKSKNIPLFRLANRPSNLSTSGLSTEQDIAYKNFLITLRKHLVETFHATKLGRLDKTGSVCREIFRKNNDSFTMENFIEVLQNASTSADIEVDG